MKNFKYTIKDPLGIHARPAGLLAKLAKNYADTTISLTKSETTVKASQLMKLMSLAIKQGDEVTVTVEGEREEDALKEVQQFFEENL